VAVEGGGFLLLLHLQIKKARMMKSPERATPIHPAIVHAPTAELQVPDPKSLIGTPAIINEVCHWNDFFEH